MTKRNDFEGITCQHDGCTAPATRIRVGQFYCDAHDNHFETFGVVVDGHAATITGDPNMSPTTLNALEAMIRAAHRAVENKKLEDDHGNV